MQESCRDREGGRERETETERAREKGSRRNTEEGREKEWADLAGVNARELQRQRQRGRKGEGNRD